MLHTVLIVTTSGSLLYEKVWVSQPRTDGKSHMFTSLLTTIQEFSKQSTGMFVSYVGLENVAITLATDDKSGLRCILFHDSGDGPDFGKLMAADFLKHFTTIFSNVKFSENREPARYQSYNTKIGDAITQSVQSILNKLKASPGIQNALLVYDDGRTLATGLDDQLGVVANLLALLTFCNDLLLAREDATAVVSVEMARQIVIVHRVGPASLLTICRRNKDPSVYNLAIRTSVDLLDRVFELIQSLQVG